MNYDVITLKKQELDRYRPLDHSVLSNLEEWFKVELTYTSNALEGNTLTRAETAVVIEKGITVGGKTLKEHLEATNHASALDYVKNLVSRHKDFVAENDILCLHGLVLKGIDQENAGRYRTVSVRLSGSAVVLPNSAKVPILMMNFLNDLKEKKDCHPVEFAALAHYRLVTIHPFVDGNGRTARLLMNLILLMNGYPPAIIRKKDRLAYISSLEKAPLGGSMKDFQNLILKSVSRSLDIYLKTLKNEQQDEDLDSENLLKIGDLAKRTNQTVATIRFWTKEGLLKVAQTTGSGYHLYEKEMIVVVQKIIELKNKRLTLEEIKNFLLSS